MAILVSDKIDFVAKQSTRDKNNDKRTIRKTLHSQYGCTRELQKYMKQKLIELGTSTPTSHQLIEIQTENEQGYICEL